MVSATSSLSSTTSIFKALDLSGVSAMIECPRSSRVRLPLLNEATRARLAGFRQATLIDDVAAVELGGKGARLMFGRKGDLDENAVVALLVVKCARLKSPVVEPAPHAPHLAGQPHV